MNKKYKNETIETKIKEEKSDLFNKYKDFFVFKYKRFKQIKIQRQKNQTSKKLLKTSYIGNKNNKSNSINYINIPNKSTANISIELNNKLNASTPNFFKINLKNNNYLIPLRRNKNKELFHYPSIPHVYAPDKIVENNLLGNYEKERYDNLKKISFIKNKSFNEKSSISFQNELRQKKILNLRQKFLLHKSNSQQNIFNIDKNLFNFSKTTKNEKFFNKSNFYNSISINAATPKSSEEINLKSKIIKVHEIDLKIEELLKKMKKGEGEKNNELKEKNNKIKKQNFLRNLAMFYDNLPSLILKKNVNKKFLKPCKQHQSHDFTQNFRTTIRIIKKEENKLDKLIKKNPIIRYLFLQKILNSLVRKIKILGDKKENADFDSNIFLNINQEIEDFITYGYEFIPEDFVINKDLESPKDLLTNQRFIETLLKTKSNIDNTINKNHKEFSKLDLDMLTENGIEMCSKNIKENPHQNLMKRFLDAQEEKERQKKSRFLYNKKIDLDKKDIKQLENNKEILINQKINEKDKNNNKIVYLGKDENKKNYSLDKDMNIMNIGIKSNKNNKKNNKKNDETLLSQIFNVLYKDIDKLDDKNKKNKTKNAKGNRNKNKEKFWNRILSKNSDGEFCVINNNNRTINSGEKSRNKKKKNFYNKYKFTSIQKRIVKSCKNYNEINLDDDYENVHSKKKSKKYDFEKEKNNDKKNLLKIEENKKETTETANINDSKTTPKLENTPEDKEDLNETIKESNSSNSSNESNTEINKEEKEISEDKEEEEVDNNKEEENTNINNNNDIEEQNMNNNNHDSPHHRVIKKKKKKFEQKKEEEIDYEMDFEKELEKEYEQEEHKNTKRRIRKKNQTNNPKNNSLQDYVLKYSKRAEENDNNRLIINLINEEEKKRKKKLKNKKIPNLNKKNEDAKEKEKEKEIKENNKMVVFFFHDMENKSLEDIEKKKIELLYKFKHDIEYKISIGDVKSVELEKYEEFKKKIINLKQGSGKIDIKDYISKMEMFFQSFREEIENDEKKKIDEDRINKYLYHFLENYNTKVFYKDIQKNKIFKIVNFSEINHINSLNNLNSN